MTALWRINLWVTLFFTLVAALGMLLLLRQASTDVQREMRAAQAMVDYLHVAASRDPASLHSGLAGNLRHIRITPQTNPELTPPTRQDWLATQLLPELPAPVTVLMDDGQTLQIAVDPRDEIEEVRDSLLQLLLLSVLAWLASLLSSRWAVARGRRVLDELLGGLQQVAQGQLEVRLPAHSIAEAQVLAGHFNTMVSTLQYAQTDNAKLTQALLALQERERAHLGQTLHDDLGQYLTGIRAQACLLRSLAEHPDAVKKAAQSLEANCEYLQQGFRALIRDLYPVVLERLELDAALQLLTDDWQTAQGIRCRLLLGADLPTLPLPSKAHLYRLVQEALTNVARHAQASEVRIRLQQRGGRLHLLVRDNGCGAQLPQRAGIGLRSISERARSLGGVVHWRSRPGRGWLLRLRVPLTVENQ